MDASRRELMMGTGSIALVAANDGTSSAQSAPAPIDYGQPSAAEREFEVVNLDLLEATARQMVAPGRFAFSGYCGDGWTYHENRRAFNDYPIMPRRLQGIKDPIDLRVKLLDNDLPFPIITAPIGGQGLVHVEGEVATARGTGMASSIYVASGASRRPMEDIAKATAGPKWFQIYMMKDVELNRWLLQRARTAGYSAIVLTADALGPGLSDEFIRLGRPFPPDFGPGNHDPALGGRGKFDLKHDISFDDIGFLRENSGLPVIVKGLLNAEDARQALAAGASAIWVSNHGGRQIDGVPASISQLKSVADAVDGRCPVILDGGVRRGIDIFKALALGATAVALGRPILWGSIVGGSGGVKSVYTYLANELRAAMLVSGVNRARDITRENVAIKV